MATNCKSTNDGHRGDASLGPVRAMQRRVSPLEPTVGGAGFIDLRSGEAPPWLHYVRAVRP